MTRKAGLIIHFKDYEGESKVIIAQQRQKGQRSNSDAQLQPPFIIKGDLTAADGGDSRNAAIRVFDAQTGIQAALRAVERSELTPARLLPIAKEKQPSGTHSSQAGQDETEYFLVDLGKFAEESGVPELITRLKTNNYDFKVLPFNDLINSPDEPSNGSGLGLRNHRVFEHVKNNVLPALERPKEQRSKFTYPYLDLANAPSQVQSSRSRKSYYIADPKGDGDCLYNGFALAFADAVMAGQVDHLRDEEGFQQFLDKFFGFHGALKPAKPQNRFIKFKSIIKEYYNSPSDIEQLLAPVFTKWYTEEFLPGKRKELAEQYVSEVVNMLTAFIEVRGDTDLDSFYRSIVHRKKYNIDIFSDIKNNEGKYFKKGLLSELVGRLPSNLNLNRSSNSSCLSEFVKQNISDKHKQDLWKAYTEKVKKPGYPKSLDELKDIADHLGITLENAMSSVGLFGTNNSKIANEKEGPVFYLYYQASPAHWKFYVRDTDFANKANNRTLERRKFDFAQHGCYSAYYAGKLSINDPKGQATNAFSLQSGYETIAYNVLEKNRVKAAEKFWNTHVNNGAGSNPLIIEENPINNSIMRVSGTLHIDSTGKEVEIQGAAHGYSFANAATHEEVRKAAEVAFKMLLAGQKGLADDGQPNPLEEDNIVIRPKGSFFERQIIAAEASKLGFKVDLSAAAGTIEQQQAARIRRQRQLDAVTETKKDDNIAGNKQANPMQSLLNMRPRMMT